MPDKNYVTWTELLTLIGATQFFWGILTAMIFFKSKSSWKEDDERTKDSFSKSHEKVCDKLDAFTEKIFEKIDSVKDDVSDLKVEVAKGNGKKPS